MKWWVDPSYDPMQDLQDCKELLQHQQQLLQVQTAHLRELTEIVKYQSVEIACLAKLVQYQSIALNTSD